MTDYPRLRQCSRCKGLVNTRIMKANMCPRCYNISTAQIIGAMMLFGITVIGVTYLAISFL